MLSILISNCTNSNLKSPLAKWLFLPVGKSLTFGILALVNNKWSWHFRPPLDLTFIRLQSDQLKKLTFVGVYDGMDFPAWLTWHSLRYGAHMKLHVYNWFSARPRTTHKISCNLNFPEVKLQLGALFINNTIKQTCKAVLVENVVVFSLTSNCLHLL